ncbi:MAG: hypothetical protein IPK80_20005 [Nannocystis sp.]|nr:hypothetical protein [Nannocystis sp.]
MLGLLSALAPLLTGPPVDAGVSWRWQAPVECPDEAMTGRALAAAITGACAARAEGAVSRSAEGWRLDLKVIVGDELDQRTLSATTCSALADAAIVIVTVACEEGERQDAVDERPQEGPEGPQEVQQEVQEGQRVAPREPVVAPPATAPRVSGAAGARARAQLGLGLAGGVAWAPTLAAAGAVGPIARVDWRRLALVGTVRYTSARTSRLAEMPALGVAQRLISAGVGLCPVWRRGRGRVAICGGGEVGALLGTGVGAPTNLTRARPWAALVLSPAIGWSLRRRVELGVGADLLVSLSRPVFALEDRGPVTSVSPWGVRLHTTLLFRVL